MQVVKPAANTHTATWIVDTTDSYKVHLQLRLTWLNTAISDHSSIATFFVVRELLFYM